MGQKKYTELETMLYDGACLLYSHSQVKYFLYFMLNFDIFSNQNYCSIHNTSYFVITNIHINHEP